MFQQPACVLGNFKSTAIKTSFLTLAKELPNPINLVDFYNISPRRVCVCVRGRAEGAWGGLLCPATMGYLTCWVRTLHTPHDFFVPSEILQNPPFLQTKQGEGGQGTNSKHWFTTSFLWRCQKATLRAWTRHCQNRGTAALAVHRRYTEVHSAAIQEWITVTSHIHWQSRHSSGAVWKSRWTSWAVRPNEPSGFRGRKDLLNRASALVTTCP